MNNTTLAEALFALAAALTAQPAETVTQTVVSVAKKGQRKIAPAVRAKVKALRAQNGGPLHSHDPTWKLIDDEIVTEQGDLIADAKAPTATKTTVTEASSGLTAAQIRGMSRAKLAQYVSRKDLIALL